MWKIKDFSMRDRLFIELRAWVELELSLSWVWVKIELSLSKSHNYDYYGSWFELPKKCPLCTEMFFTVYLFIYLLIFIVAFLWLVRVGTLLHWETIPFMGIREWRALFTYMFYEHICSMNIYVLWSFIEKQYIETQNFFVSR